MAGKRDIPTVPRSAIGTDRAPFDLAVKENLEILLGRRGTVLEPLPLTASTDDIIRKVNAIIALLQ